MEKFNKFETRLAYLSSYLQMWVNNIIYSPLIICDMDYKLISENQERNIKSVFRTFLEWCNKIIPK